MSKEDMNMKTRNLLVLATAIVALASCSNEEFVGQGLSTPDPTTKSIPISFGQDFKAVTRASHEKSAELLGKKFLLYGTKTIGGTTSPVFDNFVVEYVASSAGNSLTNSDDWEYSGKVSKKGATQTVKYWDYSAERFDFVAAAGLADDELITSTTQGMRINVTDAASMTSIYVADRITATPTAQEKTETTPATTPYNNTVQFQFRRLGAQMRIGFYETVPGYAVKDLVFYYIGAPSGSKEVGVGSAFPTSGKYTVTYDDVTNEAKVSFAGADNQMSFCNKFGQLDYTSALTQEGVTDKPYLTTDGKASATAVNAFLGTTSSTATYGKGTYTVDGESGVSTYFKPILPNENNSLKMQMRVDYTLIALDGTGDSLHVRDAYVSVPADFLKWKPNYSYTYLFKISDKSNGYTGEGGGGNTTTGPGRDPDPENGGGDNDPVIDPETGKVIPPYIPDPKYPLIDDPDNPGNKIPDPNAPLVPNPKYPEGPDGDQHDPSNPVPVPSIPDPLNPGNTIPDPENPASLFPITFDAVVVEAEEGSQTVYTEIDGTDNSSTTEH